jgi:site-specific DNA-methyltransferase (adenine-specific)
LPKPYYRARGITIYHGDCRDVLPSIRDVDLVLTDPPFFMPATHYQSRVKWQRAWSDPSILSAFWRNVVDLSVDALKDTGHFLTFCNGESYPVFYPEMYRRFETLKTLVWDKQAIGLGRVWRNQHELIIAGRWAESRFEDDGKTRSDVLRFKATRARRDHPVQKPVDMLADLISPTTPRDGLVCDPFIGSGTTLEAAAQLGRKAVGIEGEERYCEIAAKRLETALKQAA